MLRLDQINNSSQKKILIDSFDPQSTTWMVSDLRTKFSLQKHLIDKYGFFEDQTVVRANEYWAQILKKFDHRIKIVSTDYVLAWITDQIKKIEHPLLKSKPENMIQELMDYMVHLWTHPFGEEVLQDWFIKNKSSQERWGFWAQISFELGQKAIKENFICHRWIPAYLSHQSGWERFCEKNLIIDLGPDLKKTEAELFKMISKHKDVHLLQPMLEESDRFWFLLKPYQSIIDDIGKVKPSDLEKISKVNLEQKNFLRLTSPLAEVKYITAEIRKLIEDKMVKPAEIAVIAPEIESYWPLIDFYFSEEGLVSNKDRSFRLHSIPAVSSWLSQIRISLASIQFVDLEATYYQKNSAQQLRFEKFEALFKNILDVEDLNRYPEIEKAFYKVQTKDDFLNQNEFISYMVRFWPEHADIQYLEILMKEILSQCQSESKFNLSTWLTWVEQITAKKEIKIQSGSREGVQLLNLSMADQPSIRYRFFIGLTENNFRIAKNSLIQPNEVESLFESKYGFHLQHPEQSQLEFELRWLARQQIDGMDTFLCPMTDHLGSETAPHRFWLEGTYGKEVPVSNPQYSRHDLLQFQSEEKIIQDKKYIASDLLLQQIKNDQSDEVNTNEIQHFPVKQKMKLSLSALESFYQCPFQFAASYVFKLLRPSEVDLGISYSSMGNITHALFYHLTAEPRRYDYSESEIQSILDKIYSDTQKQMMEHGEYLGDQHFWQSLRQKLVRLGQKFLKFEDSQKIFGHKIKEREFRFSFEWNNIIWNGVIDRIDTTGDGHYLVYDYKPRNKFYEYSQWEKNKNYQVGFYAWGLQKGFIQTQDQHFDHTQDQSKKKLANVVGAQYYIYKNFEKKGIKPDSQDREQQFDEFYQNIEGKIQNFQNKIQEGVFPALPRDLEKVCENCRWSKVCRAPHLNQ